MTEVNIPVATSATPATVGAIEVPKMHIYNDQGLLVLVVPYAPRSVSYSDQIAGYSEIDRATGKSYLMRNREKLEKVSFTLNLTRLDHQEDIEDLMDLLKTILNDKKPVFLAYGPRERRHWWRATNLSFDTSMRTAENKISRTDALCEFTEHNDPPPIPKKGTGSSGTPIPSSYKVVSGDTLTKISIKFYGVTSYVSAIAKLNKIKTTTKLKTGQTLKLPKKV